MKTAPSSPTGQKQIQSNSLQEEEEDRLEETIEFFTGGGGSSRGVVPAPTSPLTGEVVTAGKVFHSD